MPRLSPPIRHPPPARARICRARASVPGHPSQRRRRGCSGRLSVARSSAPPVAQLVPCAGPLRVGVGWIARPASFSAPNLSANSCTVSGRKRLVTWHVRTPVLRVLPTAATPEMVPVTFVRRREIAAGGSTERAAPRSRAPNEAGVECRASADEFSARYRRAPGRCGPATLHLVGRGQRGGLIQCGLSRRHAVLLPLGSRRSRAAITWVQLRPADFMGSVAPDSFPCHRISGSTPNEEFRNDSVHREGEG